MDSLTSPNRRMPWRGFIVGGILCFCLSVFEPYVMLLLHTSGLCTDYISAGAIFFLFLTVIVVALFRWLSGRIGLSRRDLGTAVIMLLVGCAIPSHGLLAPLYPVITGAYYYATPENNWATLIHPYLPTWMAPDDPEAIKFFFEGSPDQTVPWQAWTQPFIAWGILIFAAFFVMICMMVILRKQWVEQEKLLFPLIRLPLEMICGDERGRFPFLRNPLMWTGFLISFAFVGINGLNYYYHGIPVPVMRHYFRILRGTTTIGVALNFSMLGLSYLLSLDIAFSIWFFHLFLKLESGLLRIIGFTLKGHREMWGGSSLATTHQNGGALIVLVLFGLWTARGHLKNVLRKTFTSANDIDDSGELLPYRVAFLGMIIGLFVIGGWLKLAGMPLRVVPVIVFCVFVVFLALSRIIAQAGVGFMCTGISPPVLATSSIGTAAFDTQGLVAMGTLYTWAFEGRALVMTSVINGLKLAGEVRLKKRSLFLPIIAAILIMLVGTSWMILRSAYAYGGINLRANWFVNMPQYAWQGAVANKLLYPVTLDMVYQRWVFMAIGGGIMWFLIFVGTRLLWWPLHYIGFPIADIWMMNQIWFNVFLAFIIKLAVLRYGGPQLYRKSIGLFLGFVIGQIFVGGLWMLIDTLNNAVGNFINIGLG